jgi:hypothetical protein
MVNERVECLYRMSVVQNSSFLFFILANETMFSDSFEINLPNETVDRSARAYVSVIGEMIDNGRSIF